MTRPRDTCCCDPGQTHNEFTVTPIWNVIGVVPSHKYGTADDRVIVIGTVVLFAPVVDDHFARVVWCGR